MTAPTTCDHVIHKGEIIFTRAVFVLLVLDMPLLCISVVFDGMKMFRRAVTIILSAPHVQV